MAEKPQKSTPSLHAKKQPKDHHTLFIAPLRRTKPAEGGYDIKAAPFVRPAAVLPSKVRGTSVGERGGWNVCGPIISISRQGCGAMGASEGWVWGASGWFFAVLLLEGGASVGERGGWSVGADYFRISQGCGVMGGIGGGRSIGGGAVTIL